jgi:hypothetical protein
LGAELSSSYHILVSRIVIYLICYLLKLVMSWLGLLV